MTVIDLRRCTIPTFCGSLPSRKAGHSAQRQREKRTMENQDRSLDRRLFLGGSALTLLGASAAALAQQDTPQAPKPAAAAAATAMPTHLLTDFIAGFELKQAPPLALERARTAFIDTVGVMLAGSRSEPAAIVLEMVKAEGAVSAVSIVGQSLRTSPQ